MDLKMNSSSASRNVSSCPIKPQHISIPVLYCLVFLVGFLLNVFSLWVFVRRTPVWKSGTVLQFHLAVSDVIICPMAPFMAVYYHTSNWVFGKALCWLKIALIISHICSSLLFLTLISFHRYVAVVRYNQNSNMNQKDFVQKLCFGVWLFVFIKGTLLASLLDTSVTVTNHTLCLSVHQEEFINIYIIGNFAFFIPALLLAFTVSAVCYSRVVRSMSCLDTSHDNGKAIKRKSHKMVAVCLAIFIICFTPMNVVRSVGIMVKKFLPQECDLLLKIESVYYASWILTGANCCLDPIIYCFSSQKFVKTFHISLHKIGLRIGSAHEYS